VQKYAIRKGQKPGTRAKIQTKSINRGKGKRHARGISSRRENGVVEREPLPPAKSGGDVEVW